MIFELLLLFLPFTTGCMKETTGIIDTCTIGNYKDITDLISYLSDLKAVFDCFKKNHESPTTSADFISQLSSFVRTHMQRTLCKDHFIERCGYPSFNQSDQDTGILLGKEVDLFHPRVLRLMPLKVQTILTSIHNAYLNERTEKWCTITPPDKKKITLTLFSKSLDSIKAECMSHSQAIQDVISCLHVKLTELCSRYEDPKLLWEHYIL